MFRNSWVAATFLLALVTGATGDTPKETSYRFDIKVLEGDPLGSRQDKTQEVVSQPQILAYENCEGTVETGHLVQLDGEEVFVGAKLRIKPQRAKDGAVRLSMVFKYTEIISEKEDSLLLQSNQDRYVRTVKPGELLRLKIGKMGKSAEGQRWVELTLREFDQDR
jgi:hypothetical protein